MAVTISWSEEENGPAKTSSDLGSIPNGTITTEKTLYISHNGSGSVTNLKLYLIAKEGTYSGNGSGTEEDRAELISWGDASISDNFGGLQVSMDNGTTWPTFSNKTSSNGLAFTCRTGVADSLTNAVKLKKEAIPGGVTDGTIPTGVKAKIRVRVVVPNNEDILGKREFSLQISADTTV